MDQDLTQNVLAGAYWLKPPGPACDIVIAAMGAMMPEALEAHGIILEDCPDAGVLAITSPDQLHQDWLATERRGVPDQAHLARLFASIPNGTGIVTLADAHPATLSWIGATLGRPVAPLGVEGFGQSADLPDLYQALSLDAEAILDAAARLIWRATAAV
jgi:pyruvate dehydrogenase E1 component